MRPDGRATDELRPVSFERDFTDMADGSVLVAFGRTRVLCTVSIEGDVPRWMRDTGKGWVTAEYNMLPGSSPERIRRRVSGLPLKYRCAMIACEVAGRIVYDGGWKRDFEETLDDYIKTTF